MLFMYAVMLRNSMIEILIQMWSSQNSDQMISSNLLM